ncbi:MULTISPECIES: hypothetical protein [Bradyrhizobium]|uniref:hypothetical protein n=1 Tax=Bradyrhizobium TaxID=374 RepID=UPI0004B33346|nr:hypothetical protein [Bradyrhizobium elkanii]WLA84138.1 hypothetical protein QNJ99_07730 [Bradyrhizobium elkanii]
MTRRVRSSGEIRSNVKFIFVSEALVDQPVRIVEFESGDHVVRFYGPGRRPHRLIDRRGKIKNKLDADAVEAETVRLIFNLYLDGDGKTGPLEVAEQPQRADAALRNLRRRTRCIRF